MADCKQKNRAECAVGNAAMKRIERQLNAEWEKHQAAYINMKKETAGHDLSNLLKNHAEYERADSYFDGYFDAVMQTCDAIGLQVGKGRKVTFTVYRPTRKR